MKKIISQTTLSLILITTQFSAFAGRVIKDTPVVQTFMNTDCELNDSCDLKKFELEVYDYKVLFSSEETPSYGTSAKFSYETDKVESLENYAFVQFIRGCVYTTEVDESGVEQKYFSSTREFFGEYEDFIHMDWVIDSVDTDAMYNNGDPGMVRHGFYKYDNDKGKKVYYVQKKPAKPVLYATDLPSGAYFKPQFQRANNNIFEFKVCIYKTEDIPQQTVPNDLNFATPIHCFNWESKNIYDRSQGKFVKTGDINKLCQKN